MPASKARSTTHATTPSITRPAIDKRLTDDGDEFIRTKILLLGLRRSGKTSIQQVLFDDLNPKQSFFVEPTTRLTKHKVDSFIPLEIWDCPGTVTTDSLGVPLSVFTTIIFVVDIQDSYHHPIARLIDFFIHAFQMKPEINLEIFVHKAEALSEDFRNESFRHVQGRLLEELADLPPLSITVPSPSTTSPPATTQAPFDAVQIPLMFHLTSVYDHSLQDAFARVLTRILAPGCLPYLEELLNAFCTSSHSSKAFLFDVKAKFFVATDSSPVDNATHGLCCDYVHMLNEFGGLFKSAISSPSMHPRRTGLTPDSSNPSSVPSSVSPTIADSSLPSSPKSSRGQHGQSPQTLSAAASRAPTPTHTASTLIASSPTQINAINNRTTRSDSLPSNSSQPSAEDPARPAALKPRKSVFHPSSATNLTPFTTLIYYQITPRLALLALLPTTVWDTKRGLVEYNVVFFREGVQEIYEVEQDSRRRKRPRVLDPLQQSQPGRKLTTRGK